jgi:hypothetical protein
MARGCIYESSLLAPNSGCLTTLALSPKNAPTLALAATLTSPWLAGARTKAQEFRNVLAQGIDPQEHRQGLNRKSSEAYANTFQCVADKWLKLKKPNVSKRIIKKSMTA